MSCPTCDHTMHCLGVLEGRTHYHCPRCGTHRIHCGYHRLGMDKSDPIYHDTVPSLVEFLRGFVRMISPGPEGRYLRNAAETASILEAVHKPADRPQV